MLRQNQIVLKDQQRTKVGGKDVLVTLIYLNSSCYQMVHLAVKKKI